jgi:uncharacterized iron-regulated protein
MGKFILGIMLVLALFSQDKPAYKIFDKDGNPVTYSQVIEKLKTSQFVLLGEHHNDAMAHWLHYQMVKDLYTAADSAMTIGVEFFERDDQLVLDEYFAGYYSEKKFLQETHSWSNYETDYRPVLEFAKKNNIRYVGTNIPRRYASMINKKGVKSLDLLSHTAKGMIAPLPFPIDTTLKSYKKIFKMMKRHGGTWNMVYSQMSKDATMAWFSVQNYVEGNLFVHIMGLGHSDYYEGVGWYIKKYLPEAKIMTVSLSAQKDISTLDQNKKNIADFIIAVPSDFSKTYRSISAK